MKKTFLLISLLVLIASFAACKSKEKETKEVPIKPPSALEAAGDVITGDALTDDYVKILCGKYKQCGIKAFQDDRDCGNRIRTILEQDAKWKELRMDKKALKTCLKDFEGFACEDFRGGKSPDSCRKM